MDIISCSNLSGGYTADGQNMGNSPYSAVFILGMMLGLQARGGPDEIQERNRKTLLNHLHETVSLPEAAKDLGVDSLEYRIAVDANRGGQIRNVQITRQSAACPACEREILEAAKGAPRLMPYAVNGVFHPNVRYFISFRIAVE